MQRFNSTRRLARCLVLGANLVTLAACSAAKPQPAVQSTQPHSPEQVSFVVKGAPNPAETATAAVRFAEFGVEFKLPGSVQVGPAPNGQLHQDDLSEVDASTLNQSWAKWLQAGFKPTENCVTLSESSPLYGLFARVSIQENQREVGLIRVDSSQVCGPAAPETLLELASTTIELAKKHYPSRFPDECLAATDRLSSLHREVASCTSDEQCSNVDLQYDAIPADRIEYVAVRSCSMIPVLSAANAEQLGAEKKQLFVARDAAQKVCGNPEVCTAEQQAGFQNHRYRARCVAGRCTAGKVLHSVF